MKFTVVPEVKTRRITPIGCWVGVNISTSNRLLSFLTVKGVVPQEGLPLGGFVVRSFCFPCQWLYVLFSLTGTW